jgi:UDP-glucose 4-epimerase
MQREEGSNMEDVYPEYEEKVILVTGGAGAIGGNLCRRLSGLNASKVIILDDLSSSYEWNIPRAGNIVFVRGSILDDEMLKRVFKPMFSRFPAKLPILSF